MSGQLCPCCSMKPFKDCCGPFLDGQSKPQTPEALMRSRYSAFYTKNINYLLQTRHLSKQNPDEHQQLVKTIENTHWIGLKILQSEIDAVDPVIGYVEFAAFYKTEAIGQVHERSRFRLDDGQWYYVDGQFLAPLVLKRNELCFCMSQKKYKRCHGK